MCPAYRARQPNTRSSSERCVIGSRDSERATIDRRIFGASGARPDDLRRSVFFLDGQRPRRVRAVEIAQSEKRLAELEADPDGALEEDDPGE